LIFTVTIIASLKIQSTGNLTEKLDLKELAAGVYFISFTNRSLSQVRKNCGSININ